MSIEAHQAYDKINQDAPAHWLHRLFATLLKALVPAIVVAVAVHFSWELYTTAPVAERTARDRVPRLVETVTAVPLLQGPVIEAWGEVIPARELVLRPEVAGRVTEIHPGLVSGGEVLAGDLLLAMDAREWVSALAEAEADIAEIKARIAIEEGQAARALRDLQRGNLRLTDAQRALVLREPQMDQLKAELEAAEAVRDRRALDLDKARMEAPFDALVMSEEVAPGASVPSGGEVARLVASEAFTVSLAVPARVLEWIDIDARPVVALSQPGVWPEGQTREGTILRRGAKLSETGRLVELIVEVEDPLNHLPENKGRPKLLLGSFLRAEISGRPVDNAVALDRAYLRDDATVWVMTEEDKLEIRQVEVAWRGAETVLISEGLAAGDRVITTHLAVSAPGMALRLREDG